MESAAWRSSPPSEEHIAASRAKTNRLLLASFRHDEHKAFKEHLDNNLVQQNLYGSLAFGIELVMSKKQTMSDVAPTLKMLLQYGAKWDGDDLPGKTTPYHVICQSTGDHYEILDLMIKELGPTLLDTKDNYERTALMCAVHNVNIKCVETLIANGSDVNVIGNKYYYNNLFKLTDALNMVVNPLISSISMMASTSHCSDVTMGIFDLLLKSGAKVIRSCNLNKRTPVMYAAEFGNVNCVKKLIEKGAELNYRDSSGHTVSTLAARTGSVDVLKCLIEDNGMDKNYVDNNDYSLLFWAVRSGNIEAVRYLLNLGVTISTYRPQEYIEPCKVCRTIIGYSCVNKSQSADPYMLAISENELAMMKLMDEYGCQVYKSFEVLSRAVSGQRTNMVEYLLCNHKYPLNHEHIAISEEEGLCDTHQTILELAFEISNVKIVKLLIEHSADPNMKPCNKNSACALNYAMRNKYHIEVIPLLIRGGANVNTASYCPYPYTSDMRPFEAAIWIGHFYAAQMLLVTGSSRGEVSLNKNFKVQYGIISSELKTLMKEWNVHINNVLPLQQKCRMVILNHLSPQADKKITRLSLSPLLIKYLSIPELDDIIEPYKSDHAKN